VLIKSKRHCCICGKWCGQRIEVHHIEDSSDSSEENALPLCLDCHAEVRSYDPKHPIGKKYTASELMELKRQTFLKYSGPDVQSTPVGNTEYGHGFSEGAEWAKTQMAMQEVWRLLSVHGDFALEVLYLFRKEDRHTMMDEILLSDRTNTGSTSKQSEGHLSAWRAGEVLGLWGTDGSTEELFLTEKGIKFRNMVRSTPELIQRLNQLELFWDSTQEGKGHKKPVPERLVRNEDEFSPGPMNALYPFINYLATTSADPQTLYIIKSVLPGSTTLSSIADGSEIVFSAKEIRDVRLDQKTGNYWIQIQPFKDRST
jgi:hypothetical protein